MATFRCSNVNRPKPETKEAPIGKDGSSTVKTLVGQNFVEVCCKEGPFEDRMTVADPPRDDDLLT